MRNAKKQQKEDSLRTIKQNIDLVINPMAKSRQALRNTLLRDATAQLEASKPSKGSKAGGGAAAAAAGGDMEDL
jgi:hypothetical protein